MATRIDWSPSADALHQWYTELTGTAGRWPPPRPDAPSTNADHRRSARKHWCERVRATYVTVSKSTTLFRNLMTLGAPLDVLTGTSYVADELTHHLGMLVHVTDPFDPPARPAVPDGLLDERGEISWRTTFEESLELYAFNLAISEPTYRAIAAVSSDEAVVEIASLLAENIRELTDFGAESLQWMRHRLSEREIRGIRRRLPALLSAYESLCGGNPELLDGVAGAEVTIETDPGNLGSLRDDQLAFMFYDTLGSTILPMLDTLGWDGTAAWQRHYDDAEDAHPESVAVAAGIGLPSPRRDLRAGD